MRAFRKYFYRITLSKTVFHTKTVWWELISYFLSRLLCLESFLPCHEPPDIYPRMLSEFPTVRDFYIRKRSRNFVSQSFLLQRSAIFLPVFSWSQLTNRKSAQLKQPILWAPGPWFTVRGINSKQQRASSVIKKSSASEIGN